MWKDLKEQVRNVVGEKAESVLQALDNFYEKTLEADGYEQSASNAYDLGLNSAGEVLSEKGISLREEANEKLLEFFGVENEEAEE